ncbi:MAG TPA: response regulator [Gemmatimonadaceae bacterium]|nr:response regulator [Gemmatimonadaceae bacterium]
MSQSESPAAAGAARKCRVLVVDDSHDACDSLAAVVRMIGHEAATAYDGEQAVEAAAEYRPDIILMDLTLPRLSGYEAAAQIQQQPGGTNAVLVALTGWGGDEDRRNTLAAGFQHHFIKPLDFEALRKLITATLATPH